MMFWNWQWCNRCRHGCSIALLVKPLNTLVTSQHFVTWWVNEPTDAVKRCNDRLDCVMYLSRNSTCTLYLYLYLYLRLMGDVAGQLRMPIMCQCRSSVFLNMLIDGPVVACSTRWQSVNWKSSVWVSCDILAWTISASDLWVRWWHLPVEKNLLQLTCSFQLVFWTSLSYLHVIFVFSRNRYPTSSTWSRAAVS